MNELLFVSSGRAFGSVAAFAVGILDIPEFLEMGEAFGGADSVGTPRREYRRACRRCSRGG